MEWVISPVLEHSLLPLPVLILTLETVLTTTLTVIITTTTLLVTLFLILPICPTAPSNFGILPKQEVLMIIVM